jgi:hypothetical protein
MHHERADSALSSDFGKVGVLDGFMEMDLKRRR